MTQSRERVYSPEESQLALGIARRSLIAVLEGKNAAEITTDIPPFLQEHRGCFVTLRSVSGRLRGCVGTFDTTEHLLGTLTAMAAAATRDSRFVDDPVTMEEVEDLVLSVRVLTPPEPLSDPLLLDVGNEGLYILGKRDAREVRGCFLPEVAIEQGWDARELVSRCCADKMKLPRDTWKPPTELQFFTFRAIGMSED